MTHREHRRPSATLFLALLVLTACNRAAPSSAQPESTEEDPRFAAPTLERLTTPATSPFAHAPVSWQYSNTRLDDDEPVRSVRVAMTTIDQRVVVEGIGLLFKLVVYVETGDGEGQFRSYVALLTPEGLYMSEPNSFRGDLAESAQELVEGLRALGPSWPLPSAAGCTSRLRDARLPFGDVRGVETHCQNLLTPIGHVDVTTLWVDRVGFVYRESTRLRTEGSIVRRDVLTSGDLIDLAAASLAESPEPLP